MGDPMQRMSRVDTFMGMALLLAGRSTCIRRAVGCVAVDMNHHVIGSGYNGPPRGSIHCIQHPCATSDKSGMGLDTCRAIHAEQNALLQCPDVMAIRTIYTTAKPCVHCIKLIQNTGCREVIYLEDYPHKYEVRPDLIMTQHINEFLSDLQNAIIEQRDVF